MSCVLLSAISPMFKLTLRIAEHTTSTAENPINENMNSEVRFVKTFKSNVIVVTKPIKNKAITQIVITIIQVVRFANFILFVVFMKSVVD